eukprot:TRINITY_DN65445_c1_g4_i1.p1 TRINITY_DN65445_c1_g4~~TRINITY_DN65445_c1_g4_i1.p1  ORF type:complete len:408 (+),score=45.01 TRINITY_DN65445_c1_g4_i1:1-1224(+)
MKEEQRSNSPAGSKPSESCASPDTNSQHASTSGGPEVVVESTDEEIWHKIVQETANNPAWLENALQHTRSLNRTQSFAAKQRRASVRLSQPRQKAVNLGGLPPATAGMGPPPEPRTTQRNTNQPHSPTHSHSLANPNSNYNNNSLIIVPSSAPFATPAAPYVHAPFPPSGLPPRAPGGMAPRQAPPRHRHRQQVQHSPYQGMIDSIDSVNWSDIQSNFNTPQPSRPTTAAKRPRPTTGRLRPVDHPKYAQFRPEEGAHHIPSAGTINVDDLPLPAQYGRGSQFVVPAGHSVMSGGGAVVGVTSTASLDNPNLAAVFPSTSPNYDYNLTNSAPPHKHQPTNTKQQEFAHCFQYGDLVAEVLPRLAPLPPPLPSNRVAQHKQNHHYHTSPLEIANAGNFHWSYTNPAIT